MDNIIFEKIWQDENLIELKYLLIPSMFQLTKAVIFRIRN